MFICIHICICICDHLSPSTPGLAPCRGSVVLRRPSRRAGICMRTHIYMYIYIYMYTVYIYIYI